MRRRWTPSVVPSGLAALSVAKEGHRVSSKKSAPPKPKEILGKSADKPLWAEYQQLIRLRRVVQDAEAGAAQSSKEGGIGDASH